MDFFDDPNNSQPFLHADNGNYEEPMQAGKNKDEFLGLQQEGGNMFEGLFAGGNLPIEPLDMKHTQYGGENIDGRELRKNDETPVATVQSDFDYAKYNDLQDGDGGRPRNEAQGSTAELMDMDVFYDSVLDASLPIGNTTMPFSGKNNKGNQRQGTAFPSSQQSHSLEDGFSANEELMEAQFSRRFRGDSIDSGNFRGLPGSFYAGVTDNVSLNGGRGGNYMVGNFGNDLSPITTNTSVTPSLNSAHSTQPSFFSAQQYLSRNSMDQPQFLAQQRPSLDHFANSSLDRQRTSLNQAGRNGRYASFTNSISNYLPFMSDRNQRSPNLRTPTSNASNSPASSVGSPEGVQTSPRQSMPKIRGIFRRSNNQAPVSSAVPNNSKEMNFLEISGPIDIVKINAETFGFQSNPNYMNMVPTTLKEEEDLPDENLPPRKNKRSKRSLFTRFKSTPAMRPSLSEENTENYKDEATFNATLNDESSLQEKGSIDSPGVFTVLNTDAESNSSSSTKNIENVRQNPEHEYSSLFGNIGRKRNIVNPANYLKLKTKSNGPLKSSDQGSLGTLHSSNDKILDSESGVNYVENFENSRTSEDLVDVNESNFSGNSDSMYSGEEGSEQSSNSNLNLSSTLANASKRILGSKLMLKRKSNQLPPVMNKPPNPASMVQNGVEVEIDLTSLDLPPDTQVFPTSIVNSKRRTRGRKENLEADINDLSKIFLCNYCSRRFKRQEHLKRHFRSLHTFEKPYTCNVCNKKFSRSDNLNQHLKIHKQGDASI